jgi:carboxypeptidase Q
MCIYRNKFPKTTAIALLFGSFRPPTKDNRMDRRTRLPALTLIAASLLGGIATAGSAFAATPGSDPAALAKVRDTAMQSDYAYQRLEDLTDLVGPRLSGSAGAAAAVTQVADELRKLGAKVTLQPVKVPHWVRGAESGEIVDYKGRPSGVSQKVVLTALGGSGATPAPASPPRSSSCAASRS